MSTFERVFRSIYGECSKDNRTLSCTRKCDDAASHKLRFRNILMFWMLKSNARAFKRGSNVKN